QQQQATDTISHKRQTQSATIDRHNQLQSTDTISYKRQTQSATSDRPNQLQSTDTISYRRQTQSATSDRHNQLQATDTFSGTSSFFFVLQLFSLACIFMDGTWNLPGWKQISKTAYFHKKLTNMDIFEE
ncbi:hypothetical protein BgiBS90_014662, partial [Biomphalaria glabrata]